VIIEGKEYIIVLNTHKFDPQTQKPTAELKTWSTSRSFQDL